MQIKEQNLMASGSKKLQEDIICSTWKLLHDYDK